MTTGAPVMSGNDLRDLRRGLGLTDESFAKYLGVTAKYYRRAERFKDNPIDDKQFKGFLEKLVYIAPRMIITKMKAMQEIAEGLKLVSTKVQRTEKWLRLGDRSKPEDAAPAEDAEEPEARKLSSGGIDKRTVHED